MASGGKAKITFGTKYTLGESRKISTNLVTTNFGNTQLCEWLNGEFFESFPTDLKSVAKTFTKSATYHASVGYLHGSFSGKVLVPVINDLAENNVDFDSPWADSSQDGNGSKYPIFTSSQERRKRVSNESGAYAEYWTSSIPKSETARYTISITGAVKDSRSYQSDNVYVVFCFCI